MLDRLTSFGTIKFATANGSGATKVSDVINMIDACRLEAGPYDLRLAIYPKALATQDIVISLLESDTLNGGKDPEEMTAAELEAATLPSSADTVITKTVKAADVKKGQVIKIGFPLSHKKYLQLSVTTTGTAEIFAGLEFGA